MECATVKRRIHDYLDGRLPPAEAGEAQRHIASCPGCAAEEASLRKVGDLVRLWAEARAAERDPQLAALWTRVSAGIGERKETGRLSAWMRRWAWIPVPALVLAVLALLFYPSDGTKAPFQPKSFDVAVESLESGSATVALVDRGEEMPRVIWILENGRS